MRAKQLHRPLICLLALFVAGSMIVICLIAVVIDCDGKMDCDNDGYLNTTFEESFIKFKVHPEKVNMSTAVSTCRAEGAVLWEVRVVLIDKGS